MKYLEMFFIISGFVFWISILFCLIIIIFAKRDHNMEAEGYYRIMDKDAEKPSIYLKMHMEGEAEAGMQEWKDSQIDTKFLNDLDSIKS